MGIDYASEDTAEFAARISEELDFESKWQSVLLARYRGAFPLFDTSRYRDVEWVRRKGQPRFVTPARWNQLFNDLSQFGIRNASTTAMSSAETASALLDVSTSLEPYRHASTELTAVPSQINPTQSRRRRSCSVSASWQLRVHAALQRFVDDAISKTVNIPADSSPQDVERIFLEAHRLGLRGIAVYREADGP
jgi:ribonucleoside-diphosphate reductase alpha chain